MYPCRIRFVRRDAMGLNGSYARLRDMLKIHHQASFVRHLLKLSFRVVFTWVFFSSLRLWELAHGKIYIFHDQSEAW